MDQHSDERLAGAEFVTRNAAGEFLQEASVDRTQYDAGQTAYNNAVEAYNTAAADPAQADQLDTLLANVQAARVERDNAWNAYVNDLSNWGAQDTALRLVSDANGQFEIRGLAQGNYTLVETVAPEGYALPSNAEFAFAVGPDTYTTEAVDVAYNPEDTENGAQRVNNTKLTIPQTGGIGTAIFAVAGVALMGGAAIAMKRNKEEE